MLRLDQSEQRQISTFFPRAYYKALSKIIFDLKLTPEKFKDIFVKAGSPLPEEWKAPDPWNIDNIEKVTDLLQERSFEKYLPLFLAYFETLCKQNKANLSSRWIEVAKFVGATQGSILEFKQEQHANLDNSSKVNYELQMGTAVSNISGLILITLLDKLFQPTYSLKKSINPLYRQFKTLAYVFAAAGSLPAYLLPLTTNQQKFVAGILGNLSAFIFATVFTVPYWFYRKYILKKTDEEEDAENRLAIAGYKEGWTKYLKTFYVYGTALGQAFGALYSQLKGAALTSSMAIGAGIASVGSFLIGLILVPAINYLFPKALVSQNKDTFRNNYIRSGITLGASMGSVIGFVIGTFCFPGLGSVVGMTLGGAVGSLVGGFYLGKDGEKITTVLQEKWGVSKDTDNSWDYAARTMSYQLGFLGAAIGFTLGCFVPIPGGALAGALIGSAIASVIGWFAGFVVIHRARSVEPIEPPAETIPWTQLVGKGSNLGFMLGSAIGLVAGAIVAGPAGALLGASIVGAIGGFIGGTIAVLSEKTGRQRIYRALFGGPSPATLTPLPPTPINSPPKISVIPITLPQSQNPILPESEADPDPQPSLIAKNDKGWKKNENSDLREQSLFPIKKAEDTRELPAERLPFCKSRQAKYPSYIE